MPSSKQEVFHLASEAAFGKPLVSNIYRGLIAEIIVKLALPNWIHCSEDWSGWDFRHSDGCKLEVKQSAALQSWSKGKISKPSFGIAIAKGFYNGDVWTNKPGRQSSIYVFAYHNVVDVTADHRDAAQWIFFVLPANALPPTATISLSTIRKISNDVWNKFAGNIGMPCETPGLAHAVDTLHAYLTRYATSDEESILNR